MHVSMAYPTVYIQEPGILDQAAAWIGKYGSRPFIIAGKTAWSKAGPRLEQSLRRAGIAYTLQYFGGECTYEEAGRLQALAGHSHDLVIGVGGGKCLDTAKLTASRLGLNIVTVSTLASTCAATTPLSVVYDENHQFVTNEYFDRCPILALVEPKIVAEGPVRYLIAGIGDTLAKWYEAYPLNAGKQMNAKTRLGLHIAQLARDLLTEYAEQAIRECRSREVGHAIRQVIDANILLAGLVGGIGENTCRWSGAHSFYNGMTAIRGIHRSYHGEIVAYGILCQLMLEGKPAEEIVELMTFFRKIELPVSLTDLGIDEIDEDEIRHSARLVCDPQNHIHLLPVTVDEAAVYKAIMETHKLGEEVKTQAA
jgi:glycerol dehydrogenase